MWWSDLLCSSLSICTRTRRTCVRWRRICCSYTRASQRTPSLSWWETRITVIGRHACVFDMTILMLCFTSEGNSGKTAGLLQILLRLQQLPAEDPALPAQEVCARRSRFSVDGNECRCCSEPDVWPEAQLWQIQFIPSVFPLKYSQKTVLLIYQFHTCKYIYEHS